LYVSQKSRFYKESATSDVLAENGYFVIQSVTICDMKFTVGIDEVGRGPLAGPVAVCAVLIESDMLKKIFSGVSSLRGVDDSKKLSPTMREKLYKAALASRRAGLLDFRVCYSSHEMIDARGISEAIARALGRALKGVSAPSDSLVWLDGSLKAPEKFQNQKTIIGGDAKIKIISLASVIAKVSRDRLLAKLARKYPRYGFEIHKGYGTRAHIAAIKSLGPCAIHRRSFLKNILIQK